MAKRLEYLINLGINDKDLINKLKSYQNTMNALSEDEMKAIRELVQERMNGFAKAAKAAKANKDDTFFGGKAEQELNELLEIFKAMKAVKPFEDWAKDSESFAKGVANSFAEIKNVVSDVKELTKTVNELRTNLDGFSGNSFGGKAAFSWVEGVEGAAKESLQAVRQTAREIKEAQKAAATTTRLKKSFTDTSKTLGSETDADKLDPVAAAKMLDLVTRINKEKPQGYETWGLPDEQQMKAYRARVKSFYYELGQIEQQYSAEVKELEDSKFIDKLTAKLKEKLSSIKVDLGFDTPEVFTDKVNKYIESIKPTSEIKVKLNASEVVFNDDIKTEEVVKEDTKKNNGKKKGSDKQITNKQVGVAQGLNDILAKQSEILTQTQNWRSAMINALSFKKGDIAFAFTLADGTDMGAKAVANALQDYFDHHAIKLDIDKEDFVKKIQDALDSAGLTFNGGNIAPSNADWSKLIQIIQNAVSASAMSGGAAVNPSVQAPSSQEPKQNDQDRDNEQRTDKDYFEVLTSTSNGVPRVIEAVKDLVAQLINKDTGKIDAQTNAQAFKLSQLFAKRGLDLAAIADLIANGVDGIQLEEAITSMLNDLLMTKDHMGQAKGKLIAVDTNNWLKQAGVNKDTGIDSAAKTFVEWVEHLFDLRKIAPESEAEYNRRIGAYELTYGKERNVSNAGMALSKYYSIWTDTSKGKIPGGERIADVIKIFGDLGLPTDRLTEFLSKRNELDATNPMESSPELLTEFQTMFIEMHRSLSTVIGNLKSLFGDFKGKIFYQHEGKSRDQDINGAAGFGRIPTNAIINNVIVHQAHESKGIGNEHLTGAAKKRADLRQVSYNKQADYWLPDLLDEPEQMDMYNTLAKVKKLPTNNSRNGHVPNKIEGRYAQYLEGAATYDEAIDREQRKIDTLNSDINQIQVRMDQIRDRLQELKGQDDDSAIIDEINTAKSKRQSAQNKLDESELQINQLSSQISRKEQALSNVDQEFERKQNELQSRIKSLEKDTDQQQAYYNKQMSSLSGPSNAGKREELRKSSLKQTLDSEKAELAALKEELSSLTIDVWQDQIKADIKLLKKHKKRLQKQVDDAQKEIDDATETEKQFTEQLPSNQRSNLVDERLSLSEEKRAKSTELEEAKRKKSELEQGKKVDDDISKHNKALDKRAKAEAKMRDVIASGAKKTDETYKKASESVDNANKKVLETTANLQELGVLAKPPMDKTDIEQVLPATAEQILNQRVNGMTVTSHADKLSDLEARITRLKNLPIVSQEELDELKAAVAWVDQIIQDDLNSMHVTGVPDEWYRVKLATSNFNVDGLTAEEVKIKEKEREEAEFKFKWLDHTLAADINDDASAITDLMAKLLQQLRNPGINAEDKTAAEIRLSHLVELFKKLETVADLTNHNARRLLTDSQLNTLDTVSQTYDRSESEFTLHGAARAKLNEVNSRSDRIKALENEAVIVRYEKEQFELIQSQNNEIRDAVKLKVQEAQLTREIDEITRSGEGQDALEAKNDKLREIKSLLQAQPEHVQKYLQLISDQAALDVEIAKFNELEKRQKDVLQVIKDIDTNLKLVDGQIRQQDQHIKKWQANLADVKEHGLSQGYGARELAGFTVARVNEFKNSDTYKEIRDERTQIRDKEIAEANSLLEYAHSSNRLNLVKSLLDTYDIHLSGEEFGQMLQYAHVEVEKSITEDFGKRLREYIQKQPESNLTEYVNQQIIAYWNEHGGYEQAVDSRLAEHNGSRDAAKAALDRETLSYAALQQSVLHGMSEQMRFEAFGAEFDKALENAIAYVLRNYDQRLRAEHYSAQSAGDLERANELRTRYEALNAFKDDDEVGVIKLALRTMLEKHSVNNNEVQDVEWLQNEVDRMHKQSQDRFDQDMDDIVIRFAKAIVTDSKQHGSVWVPRYAKADTENGQKYWTQHTTVDDETGVETTSWSVDKFDSQNQLINLTAPLISKAQKAIAWWMGDIIDGLTDNERGELATLRQISPTDLTDENRDRIAALELKENHEAQQAYKRNLPALRDELYADRRVAMNYGGLDNVDVARSDLIEKHLQYQSEILHLQQEQNKAAQDLLSIDKDRAILIQNNDQYQEVLKSRRAVNRELKEEGLTADRRNALQQHKEALDASVRYYKASVEYADEIEKRTLKMLDIETELDNTRANKAAASTPEAILGRKQTRLTNAKQRLESLEITKADLQSIINDSSSSEQEKLAARKDLEKTDKSIDYLKKDIEALEKVVGKYTEKVEAKQKKATEDKPQSKTGQQQGQTAAQQSAGGTGVIDPTGLQAVIVAALCEYYGTPTAAAPAAGTQATSASSPKGRRKTDPNDVVKAIFEDGTVFEGTRADYQKKLAELNEGKLTADKLADVVKTSQKKYKEELLEYVVKGNAKDGTETSMTVQSKEDAEKAAKLMGLTDTQITTQLNFKAAKDEALSLKKTIDDLYKDGKQNTEEYAKAQIELSHALSAMRTHLNKNGHPEFYAKNRKDKKQSKAAKDAWLGYLAENGFGSTEIIPTSQLSGKTLDTFLNQNNFTVKAKSFELVKAVEEAAAEANPTVAVTPEVKPEALDKAVDNAAKKSGSSGGKKEREIKLSPTEYNAAVKKANQFVVAHNDKVRFGNPENNPDENLNRLYVMGDVTQAMSDYINKYNLLIEKRDEEIKKIKETKGLTEDELKQKVALAEAGIRQQALEAQAANKIAEKSHELRERATQSSMDTFTDKRRQVHALGGIKENVDINPANMMQAMQAYAREVLGVNLDHAKLNETTGTLTGTFRQNNRVVNDMVVQYDKASNSLYLYNKQERESLGGLPGFMNALKAKSKAIMQYIASMTSIYRVLGVLRQGVTYIKEIDAALTELRKVTDATEETYDKFLDTAAKTADKVGSTIKEVVSSTADWARLGYTIKEAAELAESTQILMNVSEFTDVNQATDSLISSIQAFKYTAEESMDVVDILNTIGNNYAISTADLATSLTKSSGSLVAANGTLEEAVALTAAANTIIQDADVVGTALKTVAMRIRGTSVEEMEEEGLETDGVVSKSKLQSKVKALSGVDILTQTGDYKSTYEILSEIANVWEDISDINQAALLELLAGKRAGSVMSAILNNPDVLKDAFESANDAAGSALRENETYLDSIQGRMDQFTNAVQTMWMHMLDSDIIKGIVKFGTELVKILDKLGTVPTLLAAISTVVMVKNKFGPITLLKGISDAIRSAASGVSGFVKSFKQVSAGTSALTKAMQGVTTASFKQSLATANVSKTNQTALLSQMGLTKANAAHVISQETLNAETLAQAVNNGTLTATQAAQLASVYGLTGATAGLTAAQMSQALITAGVSREQRVAIIQSLGLGVATKQLTADQVMQSLTSAGLRKSQAAQIASTIGLTVANKGLAASFKALLTSSMGPLIIAGLIVGAIAGIVALVDHLVVTTEELEEATSDLKSELTDIETEIESLNDELETTQERMAELLAMDSLSLTEQDELQNLMRENAELERKLKLQESLQAAKQKEVVDSAEQLIEESWRGDKTFRYTLGENGSEIEEGKDGYIPDRQSARSLLRYELMEFKFTPVEQEEQRDRHFKNISTVLDKAMGYIDEYELAYGMSDEIDAYLDEIYGASTQLNQILGISTDAASVQQLFQVVDNKAVEQLDEDLQAIANNSNLTELQKQEKAITLVNKAVNDTTGAYGRFGSAMKAFGLEAKEVANYYVLLSDAPNSDTVEGITQQYAKGINVFKAYTGAADTVIATYKNLDGTTEQITWGSLFKDGEIQVVQVAKALQGAGEDVRKTFAKLAQDVYDGEITISQAMKSFQAAGLVAGFKLVETQIAEINADVFKDLGDDLSGVIDTFEEFSSALESVASSIELVDQAQAEMANSGRVSVETALQLMQSTDNWNELLEIEDGNIRLVNNKQEILVNTKLDLIKTNLQAALSTVEAQLAEITATEASADMAYTIEESTNLAVTQLAGNMAYLTEMMTAYAAVASGKSVDITQAMADAEAAKQKVLDATDYKKNAAQAIGREGLEKEKARLEAMLEIYEGIDTIDEFEDNYSTDKVSGGAGTVDEVRKNKLTELIDKYERELALITNERDLIEAEIDKAEARDGKAAAQYYQDLLDSSEDEKDLLIAKKEELEEYFAAHEDTMDPETWTEWNNEINETAVAIKECEQNTIEWAEALREIDTHYFEQITGEVSRLGEELDFVNSLLEDEDVADENGNWSNAGLTRLGLYTQQMEKAAAEAQLYQEQIDKLNAQYDNGELSEEQYQEALSDLVSGQQDAIQSYADAKDGIIELNEARIDAIKEGIEEEIEAYEDYINVVKEALDAERDLYDFKKDVAKQTKDIAALERRIAALSSSTNASDIAERRKLEAELFEAKEGLNDTYYNRSMDSQSEALDAEAEAYNEAQEKRIEELEQMLEDTETLITNSIMDVLLNADTILAELTGPGGISETYGITLSDQLTQPWDDASERATEWKNKLYEGMTTGEYAALIGEGGAITAFANDVATKMEGPWNSAQAAAQKYADFLTADELGTDFSQTITGFGDQIQTIVDKWNQVKQAADDAYTAQTRKVTVGGSPNVNAGSNNNNDTSGGNAPSGGAKVDTNVKALQNILNSVFSAGLAEDGVWGPKTESALKKVQEQVKKFLNFNTRGGIVPTVDGKFNDATRKAFLQYFDIMATRAHNSDHFEAVSTYTNAKKKLPAAFHAKGTLGTKRDEWAITDESWIGEEITLAAGKNGQLQYLKKGSAVMPADISANLVEWGKLNPNMMSLNGTPNINLISNAVNKPELNLSFDALVKADRIDEGTLPEVKRFVQQEINSLVKKMNYALKTTGGR